MLKILQYIGLGIIVIAIVGGIICWIILSPEHREGKNLPIGIVNFKNLKDGTYIGEYEGGQFKWRSNEAQITVSSGKVTEIKLLKNTEKRPAAFTEELFNRVIKAQSLQVDTISGATITSKAYLKSVENALVKAEK